MKRLLMLLTTFCLLLMTTALAETEAEWNAKCEWKTGTGTTLYAVTQGTATSSDLSDFVPVGTLPANTYVGILERSGNMRNVRYWNGSGTSSGWVDSAALVWVGSNSSKPKPSGSRATASDLSRKPDDTWNSLTVTYSDGDEAQTVSLQTLGVAMSEIYMDGEFLRVPTASLSWETEADDNQRIAVIYAPSTGKCTMREEASKKGKIIMTCKAGRVATVLRVGDVYTRIVYDGVEGLVLNSCLKFYETPDEDTFTTGLLSAKGKTNTTATVSVYQLTKSRRRLEFDKLIIDLDSYELIVDGKKIDTPPKELELLYHLAATPNRVYTRNQLLDEVWGFDYFGDSRTVDVHVKRLREKVENVSDQWALKTVWGVGYKFEVK